jgi:hypothetical protein
MCKTTGAIEIILVSLRFRLDQLPRSPIIISGVHGLFRIALREFLVWNETVQDWSCLEERICRIRYTTKYASRKCDDVVNQGPICVEIAQAEEVDQLIPYRQTDIRCNFSDD